ncbi:cobalt ABC transporter ATP-binding protein [Streptomyces alboflavus]|uniref:Cobalt ABC transporter ATP-binding protein n=1 Tax=Streptomyces alboflavus TaxID=67267 RepID=A0A1Z1WQ76_9ACTN|nr:cobalt ABC transporter ATP-binding protein [Streptomyces alboflavus]
MITFDHVSVQYDDTVEPVLTDVDLTVEEGELCLVVGHTGVGKSTLLGAVNGLVPHFTGGTLYGTVAVDGRDTAGHPPRELADVVGVVGQDPLDGFVTDTVEEELAYAMEQLAVPPATMRKRVEETLDLLGLADLRHRALHELSGGQQQRVAIGSVLTAHPRVLVLDEPTSALDPTAAEEVLAAITRLVHDLGVTVLLAEHRLERVVQYADRVLHLPGDGRVVSGLPAEIFRTTTIAPPVVELGRRADWTPLPLSVRDARRAAAPLRTRLAGAPVPAARPPAPAAGRTRLLDARGVSVRYRGQALPAVREADVELRGGETTALMGRNGSGKSSLLWALQGSGTRTGGTVRVVPFGADPGRERGSRDPGPGKEDGSRDPGAVAATEARRLVGLVPQTPTDLLYLESVRQELDQADAESAHPDGPAPARSWTASPPHRRRHPPPRPVRGSETRPGPRDPAVRRARSGPPGRADSWPRLPRQGATHRDPGRVGRRGAGGRGVDARRGVRREDRRPGRRDGRGRDRRRRPGRRSRRGLTGVRAAGGQGAGAAAVSDGGTGVGGADGGRGSGGRGDDGRDGDGGDGDGVRAAARPKATARAKAEAGGDR